MENVDSVLQGFLIGTFGLVGVITLVYCLRKKTNIQTMKKSESMEEFNSIETNDPTQTQDEERYASPPILVTKV